MRMRVSRRITESEQGVPPDPLMATALAKLRAIGPYDLPPAPSPFEAHSTTQFHSIDARPCARAHIIPQGQK